MKRTLTLLAVTLAVFAAASGAAARAADGEYHYYKLMGKALWEGEIVTRRGMTLNDDLPSRYEFCMVPPGGDWVLESKDASIEQQYLRLVERVVTSDGIIGGDGDGAGGGWIDHCGSVKRYGQIGDFQRMDAFYLRNCVSDMRVEQAHKYACLDKKLVPTGFVVVDTLKALLQSEHPETVKRALTVAREMKNAGKLFGPTIAKLVLDAKQPEDVRAAAAEALGTLVPTELSGKTIASLWLDDKLQSATRIAAMNSFAFVLGYGDAHGAANTTALKTYLPELKKINVQHTDDATGKPDAVGSAAYCAGKTYPKILRDPVGFR